MRTFLKKLKEMVIGDKIYVYKDTFGDIHGREKDWARPDGCLEYVSMKALYDAAFDCRSEFNSSWNDAITELLKKIQSL